MKQIAILFFLILLLSSCKEEKTRVDTLFYNGNIISVDKANSRYTALAVQDKKIVALGNNELLERYQTDKAKLIDLKGKTLIPAFIEGHGHFMGLGQSLTRLNFSKAKNFEEIVSMTKEAVAKRKDGEWILGRGWHQEKWNKAPSPSYNGLPYHDRLSKIAPNNPIIFGHASGHSLIANQKAMELAGITKNSKSGDGGEIIRDKKNRILGVFLENAMDAIYSAYSNSLKAQSLEQRQKKAREYAILANQHCLENGIASFHDAGAFFHEIDTYKDLVNNDELDIRLWVMIQSIQDSFEEKMASYKSYRMKNHLTVQAVKMSIDGALGSHGAWLLKPYSDLKTSSGLNLVSMDRFKSIAKLSLANHMQLGVHAIGDRANREVLNVYETLFKTSKKNDLRWRIEHAQNIEKSDLPRFADLGVIASMQAIHCTSDGPWVPKRIGNERAKNEAYLWKSLLESGAVVTNGTDVPVESINPIENYYAMVTRIMNNGKAFYPDQKLDRMEALKAYTMNNAYAAFEEDIKGSIEVGKLADFVVLDQDITKVAEDDILKTKILMTIIDGEIKYER